MISRVKESIRWTQAPEYLRVICHCKGSVVPHALTVAVPSSLLALFLAVFYDLSEEFEDGISDNRLSKAQLWAALTATLAFLIGFRMNAAYARFWEGTTLLHQMRGEWFDAVSCLMAFTQPAVKAKPAEVTNFRHSLVRLMSLCHGSALEEIQSKAVLHSEASTGRSADTELRYLDIGGLDQSTLRYLKACRDDYRFNRVEVLIHMMQTLIVSGQDSGVIKIPPPILSRVFQTISRGQVNLMNCQKIKGTDFPFAFVQMIASLLFLLGVVTPFIMATVLEHEIWITLFTFVPVFALASLNLTARELEMPFGVDSNDLPIAYFQNEMNVSMLMLIREHADHVPHVTGNCSFSFDEIVEKVRPARVREFIMEEGKTVDLSDLPSVAASTNHRRTMAPKSAI